MTDDDRKPSFTPDIEAQLEVALEVAPVWVFEQDDLLRYSWLQNAETRGLGGGATDAELLEDPSDAEAIESVKRAALTSGRAATADVVAHVQGAPHRHRLRVQPRRGPDGQITGLVGATVDLGPVDAEHPTFVAPPPATSSEHRRPVTNGALLRLLGHELRNAVNPLRMSLQLAERRRTDGDPRALDTLPAAYAGVERLTQLLQDMLDYAHSQSEPLHVDRPPTALTRILELTKERFDLLHPRAAPRLQVVRPEGPIAVLGDRKRVAQLLLTLLERPARVSADGPIHLEVRAGPEQVTFEVRDEGPTPPGSARLALEDPASFAAACLDAQRDEPPLALALASALVEALGGELLTGPGPDGRGLWVRARLPRADVPVPTPPAGQPAPLRPRRILVVDDAPGAPQTLQRLLEADGHDVMIAETGTEGLRAAETTPFDVILLDLGLPDVSGQEVGRSLRRQGHRAVLVALTGRSSEADRHESLAAGFDHYLVKPVDLRGLRRLLDRL